MSDRIDEELYALLRGAGGAFAKAEMPPKAAVDMGVRYVAYEDGQMLRAVMPVYERYAGPTGYMMGGMITEAFDMVYGPLSYLIAKQPALTITIDTHFLRPVIADGSEALTVEVNLRAKTRSMIFMEGECYNKAGKVVAASTTTAMIVQAPAKA